MMPASPSQPPQQQPSQLRRRYRPSLATQILVAVVIGALVGWLAPSWGERVYFLRDIFLNLIKSAIAPLVFSTLVTGIVGAGSLKSVGRIGVKALIYFEVVTTLALVIGLCVANRTVPGRGVVLAAPNAQIAEQIGRTHPLTFTETLVHAIPANIVDAMARGDVLQIVVFASLFSVALLALGDPGKPVLNALESLSQVMFKFVGYVMLFAPIGVGAAMAHTVSSQGIGVLLHLGKLIGSFYLALLIFVLFVFGGILLLARIPIRPFLRAVREPATIAFATTSSEAALPKAIEQMQRFGVPPQIVGFVIPTGYSFNLDGSTLYLAMASLFVVQAAETTTGYHMDVSHQVSMMLTLMVTSKGVAAVPRASLVILLATLNSFLPAGLGPLGVAIIFGVDELMDMGRTCINLVGNCLAAVVVARWEGVFDVERAKTF